MILPAYGNKLRDDFGVFAKNLVDLVPLARQVDPDFNLPSDYEQIVTFYLDRLMSKAAVRLSNWELNPLIKEQQECTLIKADCVPVL